MFIECEGLCGTQFEARLGAIGVLPQTLTNQWTGETLEAGELVMRLRMSGPGGAGDVDFKITPELYSKLKQAVDKTLERMWDPKTLGDSAMLDRLAQEDRERIFPKENQPEYTEEPADQPTTV